MIRYAKLFSIVGGSLITIVGTLWSFLVSDGLSQRAKELANQKAEASKQIQTLNSIAADYFIANQQGDLIFILDQEPNARPEIATLIYKGNLLDRATPVRNMIGALAIAKQLDYRRTYDAYEKLNDRARSELSFDNFTALKQREKQIIEQGQAMVPNLLNKSFELEKNINANAAAQKRQRMIGVVASIIGTTLLLCANVVAKNGQARSTQ